MTPRPQDGVGSGGINMADSSRAFSTPLPVTTRSASLRLRLVVALTFATAALLIALPGGSAEADERHGVIAVIDRQDIALSGAATLSELLLSRFSFNVFGLHGARRGTGSAIYLVNGRPISQLDLSTLPVSTVERVEVLNEGPVRRSTYGIGSTINIVLRNDFEGIEVSAGAGLPSRKGMDSRNGSAIWGDALGRGHMTVAAAHFERDELRAKDRHFSRAIYTPGGSFTDAQGISDHGNTVILPGNEGGRFGLGTCDESTYTGILDHPGGKVCGYPSGDIYWLRGEMSRESLQLAADQPLDDDLDVYAETRVAQGETFSVSTPNLDRFSIQPTGDVRQGLLAAVNNLPSTYVFPADESVTLLHRFVGHGNRIFTTDLEAYEFILGVRGEPDDALGYDMHVEYSKHRAAETGINLVSLSLLRDAIDSGDYDLANPLSPATEHLEAIRDTAIRSTRVEEDEFMRANASLEGETFKMAGGAIHWTVGVEVEDWNHRDVFDFRDSLNRSHSNDDVIGYGGASLVADRRRWSAMAESTMPILDGWDLTLGARRDDYDDVGEAVSLKAANRYRLNENLTFRASWNRAEHPPGMFVLNSPEAQYFVRVCDPLLTNPNGDPLCTVVHLITGGNPALGPDQVEQLSVGATTTLGGFSLAVDWFSVDHIDLPALANWQVVVDRAAAGSPVSGTSVVRNDGDNSIERIIDPIGPIGETETRGVALHAGAEWETDWVDLALDVHATRTLHYQRHVLGQEDPGGYVRDRAHAVLQARWGDITASWSVYGRSGYLNSTETSRFKGWYGHDLALQWRDVLGIGLDVAGGILNVANRDASLDPSRDDVPVRTLDSDRGRTFFLNATMAW